MKAPLRIGLETEPKAGSAKETAAEQGGWAVSTSKALLPRTQVFAW